MASGRVGNDSGMYLLSRVLTEAAKTNCEAAVFTLKDAIDSVHVSSACLQQHCSGDVVFLQPGLCLRSRSLSSCAADQLGPPDLRRPGAANCSARRRNCDRRWRTRSVGLRTCVGAPNRLLTHKRCQLHRVATDVQHHVGKDGCSELWRLSLGLRVASETFTQISTFY